MWKGIRFGEVVESGPAEGAISRAILRVLVEF